MATMPPETEISIPHQHGGIALVADDGDGTVAAFWAFAGLLKHWNRKHRKAVYVPSEHRTVPSNQYRYAELVKLGVGTDPLLLLSALECGKVHSRSQFRANLRDLGGLYDSITEDDVRAYCA